MTNAADLQCSRAPWGAAVPDRLIDDPTIPPPGRRNGEGSASILPYLVKTLASKPMPGPSVPGPRPERRPNEEAPQQELPRQ